MQNSPILSLILIFFVCPLPSVFLKLPPSCYFALGPLLLMPVWKLKVFSNTVNGYGLTFISLPSLKTFFGSRHQQTTITTKNNIREVTRRCTFTEAVVTLRRWPETGSFARWNQATLSVRLWCFCVVGGGGGGRAGGQLLTRCQQWVQCCGRRTTVIAASASKPDAGAN